MKAKILVIDDEKSIRYTFDCFLRDEGYEVITAACYDEAIECIDKTHFDLIFADVILEGNTGFNIVKEVRSRNPLCPVVFISGAPTFETAAEARQLGAVDYLAKPVLQDTLLSVTRKALKVKNT